MKINTIESGIPVDPEKVQDMYDATSAPEGSLAYLAGEVARAFNELMEKRAQRTRVSQIPVKVYPGGDSVGMYSGN